MIGTGAHQTKSIKLNDCLGDDPTCEEFYSFQGTVIDNRAIEKETTTIPEVNETITLRVFDIVGNLLYSGLPADFDKNTIPQSGILILTYSDQRGSLVKTEKIFK